MTYSTDEERARVLRLVLTHGRTKARTMVSEELRHLVDLPWSTLSDAERGEQIIAAKLRRRGNAK